MGALGCGAAFTGVFGVTLWWSWALLGGLGGPWVLSGGALGGSGVVLGASFGSSWVASGTSFVLFVVFRFVFLNKSAVARSRPY